MATIVEIKAQNDTAIRNKTAAGSITPAVEADAFARGLDFTAQEIAALKTFIATFFDSTTGTIRSTAFADSLSFPDGLTVNTANANGGTDSVITAASFKTYATSIGLALAGSTTNSSGTSTSTPAIAVNIMGQRYASTTNVASPLTIGSNESSCTLIATVANAATGAVDYYWKYKQSTGGFIDQYGSEARANGLTSINPAGIPVGDTIMTLTVTDSMGKVATADFTITRPAAPAS